MKAGVFDYSDVARVIERMQVKICGNTAAVKISKAARPEAADRLSIAWIGEKFEDPAGALQRCEASLIVAHELFEPLLKTIDLESRCVLSTRNPRLLFSAIVNALFNPRPDYGMNQAVVIHPGASIGKDVCIGPHSYIGMATIADGVVIHGHCYVYDQVFIEKSCVLHANCVIGAAGSGYVKNDRGEWENFPQIGITVLEENVEVGVSSYVARGALGETRIKKGVKIGLSACIGHNVVIGENTVVLSNAVIGGSAVIGKNAYVSMGAVIRDGVIVGDGARVGMGAVVYKDVPSGANIVGNPGRDVGRG